MWRNATAADDDAIVERCLQLNLEDPGPQPMAAATIRRTLAGLRHEPWRGRAVVLDLAATVVGYALLISFWSNEAGGELCTVDELFVDTPHRGQAHGTRLFELLAGPSALWPPEAVALSLEVTPSNHRALALYKRLGFVTGNRLMRRPRPRAG